MRKLVAAFLVLMLALPVAVLAKDHVLVDETPAFALGPDIYLGNVKVQRGPFGGGFLGTDSGWVLYHKDPATFQKTVLAAGNGRFDGTQFLAMVGAGVAIGTLNVLAATSVRPSRVSGGNASSTSNAGATASATASSKSTATGIGIGIGGAGGNPPPFNPGWIPPGHR